MKTKNLLINLGLICSLLFCMAFACGDNGGGGGGSSTNNAPPIAQNDDDSDTGSVLIPQMGVGRPYGARDPYACSDMRQPSSGAISAAQAAVYITCSEEKIHGDHLFLVENVRVNVGAGTPDKANNYLGDDIDPNSPVYPIRASLVSYSCSRVSGILENAGQNCDMFVNSNVTGSCAKTTFGDWRCRLKGSEINDVTKVKHNMPPPQ